MSYRINWHRLWAWGKTIDRQSLRSKSLCIVFSCLSRWPVAVSNHWWRLKAFIHNWSYIRILFFISQPFFRIVNKSNSVFIATAIWYNVRVSSWAIRGIIQYFRVFPLWHSRSSWRSRFCTNIPPWSWLASKHFWILTLTSRVMKYVTLSSFSTPVEILNCSICCPVNTKLSRILTVHFYDLKWK